jgi:RNA polymerase sigma factor (sigma-70 family)
LTINFLRPYLGCVPPLEAFDNPAQVQLLADLVRRYRPILARFFQKRIRPESDVDDLVQEVFTRLARKADLTEVTQIEGYLFQVAANLIRERAHKLKQSVISECGFTAENNEEDFSPERILLGEEAVQRVFAALHELPERTRNAFLLHGDLNGSMQHHPR